MSNFTLVQQTACTSASSQAFGATNTKNNCIVVIVFEALNGGTVTDTAGNTYSLILSTWGGAFQQIWACTNIRGGANTVSATIGAVMALEYSSVAPQYFVCPGHAEPGEGYDNQQIITSANSGNSISGDGMPNWTSTKETMVVFAAWAESAITATIPEGTILANAGISEGYGTGMCVGQDLVANATTGYSNSPLLMGGGNPSQSLCVFLNLTGGCAPGGIASKAPRAPRPRGNIDMDQIQPRVLRGALTGDFIATHIGGFTAGHTPTWDADGNLIDSGNSSGTGGLVTVNNPIATITVDGINPATAITIT